jgi:putative MATE family efflux protein
VLAAIRGHGGDPTTGPVDRAILLLAVPMVLEMIMESVFVVVDIFFVSRLGSQAVAAVGLTESLLTVMYTVAIGLGIGVTAMVARRTGEGDLDGAATAVVQAVALGLALSVVIGVAGVFFAPRLLASMGGDPEVVRMGRGYAAVMLGGNASILLLFLLNAALRGAGDAPTAMRVLWFANGVNMVLDPLLIFGIGPFPELGIVGAAVATNIGRTLGVVFQLLVLFRGAGRLRIGARHLTIVPRTMARIIRLSATGMLQVFIGTASWIALVRLIATFGSDALAGYTIGIRIVLFALFPAWGLGHAAATMVGQSLGAKNPERAESAVWIAGRMNLVFLGTVGLLFLAAAPAIVSVFGSGGAADAYAARCLRIVSAGFFFYAYGMVLNQSFNGAGDTWTPTLLNLVCFWLWEIPLAWLLAGPMGWGPEGVFAAITIAFCTQTLLAAAVFRRGRWKRVVV